jgi:hypothetical protein
MAKARDNYRLTGRTVDEVVREANFLLQRMADRMDKIEGIRGTSSIESDLDMNSNRVRELGEGSSSSDAARVDDLTSNSPSFNALSAVSLETTEDVEVGGNVYVYDDDGELIHSLE